MLWSQNADQVLSGFRVHFLNKTRARLAEIWGCRCFLVIICVLLVSNDNFWIWFHCLYWLNSFNQFQKGERQSWPTLGDPIDGSPQAPLSLRFSRQGYWSGLPFPSPMHESEKWKWSRSVVSDPQWPHGLQPSGLLLHGIFQTRVLEWGAIAFSAYHKGEPLFSNTFQYDDELFFCKVSLLPNKHNSGLPLWLSWQRIHLQCGRPGFNPCVGKIPWRG